MNTSTNSERKQNTSDIYLNTDGLSMETYVEVVEAQTKLNGKIINILQNEQLEKEQKQQLIGLLSHNAENASTLLALIKQKHYTGLIDGVSEEKIAEIIPEDNSVGIIDKFKNMVASFKTDLLPNVFFKNTKQPRWKEMFEISFMKINPKFSKDPTIGGFFEYINNSAKELQVFVKQKNSDLYLVGQRHRIKKLKKKYETIFSLLKIDSTKFLDKEVLKSNNDEKDIQETIDSYLKSKFGATRVNDEDFDFSILNGLTPQLQFEMLSNVLLKEVVSQITNAHQMNLNIEEEKNNNRFYKTVLDFSSSHKLNPTLVIHSLKNDSEIFNSYDDFINLSKNKDNILNAFSNYSAIEDKNNKYIGSLLDITNSIIKQASGLNVDQELVQEIYKEIGEVQIPNGLNKTILLSEIEAHINKLRNNIEHTKEHKINKKI